MAHLSSLGLAVGAIGLATPALADPLSIGVAVLVNVGFAGEIGGALTYLIGYGVLAAGFFGASLLSSALGQGSQGQKGQDPTPSDRQSTVRQSVGPRLRFYGRVKVGGSLWFFESKGGILYTGVTLNWGTISGIRETWLNDSLEPLYSDGSVISVFPYIRLTFRYGTADQAAEPRFLADFPGVLTAEHRLAGMAYVTATFTEVAADEIPNVYPQGNPGVRIVMDASVIKSVRTGVMAWSDNPADCIYDFLTALDPAGFPYGAGFAESQIDLASFQHLADLCDEDVPLKAGGMIKRYRLWGGYALNEEQRTVLPRLLAACDGDLYVNAEGKIAIRGGEWIEPVLTLDSDLGHIISGEFRQGQSKLSAFNELPIIYTEPELDYQETEGDAWVDFANQALRGETLTAEPLKLSSVPHHAQARRLGKIRSHKGNPRWSGTIVTNFYGLNALGETTARVKFGPLGIDETFLIVSVRILDDLTGAQIEISSLSAAAYDWDAELEEGLAPNAPPDTTSPIDLPPPEDVAVDAAVRDVDGVTVGTYLVVTWAEPARTALLQDVQYQESPSGPWLAMTVAENEGSAESGLVNTGGTYNVRVRTRSPGGATGDWFTIAGFVATP